MSAKNNAREPRWEPSEVSILVDAYATGGINLAVHALPLRSRNSIHAKLRQIRKAGTVVPHRDNHSRVVVGPRPRRLAPVAVADERREARRARREPVDTRPRFDSRAMLMAISERLDAARARQDDGLAAQTPRECPHFNRKLL